MITFWEAYKKVIENSVDYGNERVPLENAVGRVLAENIVADRDFPPFDRATKDGIALNYRAVEEGITALPITGTIAAGTPQATLSDPHHCLEIMTGAVLPKNTDTVVMYEHLTLENGRAILNTLPIKGQEIHARGSDRPQGSLLLKAPLKITAADIGVLAAVGKAQVLVRKIPRTTLVSTGDELVGVDQVPQAHQIRKSNMQSLHAALLRENIYASQLHLTDDRETIREELLKALAQHDIVLMSGGVSKGKFDHIPSILEELQVEKVFHGVLQRPGKPFWFGRHAKTGTVIFSFPGNPVSTFVNYHLYFLDWWRKSMGLAIPENTVILNSEIMVSGNLTLFMGVKINLVDGQLLALLVHGNGSGDLTGLSNLDGFVRLHPKEGPYRLGDVVPFIPTKPIL